MQIGALQAKFTLFRRTSELWRTHRSARYSENPLLRDGPAYVHVAGGYFGLMVAVSWHKMFQYTYLNSLLIYNVCSHVSFVHVK